MSELQISLAVLGAVAVAGVVAYNAWVARRHQRTAERMLPAREADPLLAGHSSGESGGDSAGHPGSDSGGDSGDAATGESGAAPRAEPGFNADAGDAGAGIAAAPSRGADAPARPLGNVEPPAGLLDSRADYLLRLDCVEAVSGDRLLLLERDLAYGAPKRVRVIGFNAARNEWELPRSGVGYLRLLAGMQLVDRKGAANAVELGAFSQAVQGFVDEAMAVVDAPPSRAAAESARELDAVCAQADIQVGINVASRGQPFVGARLRSLVEASGLHAADDGSLQAVGAGGETLFSVIDHDGQPLSAETLRGGSVRGLTFLLDAPRVAAGERVFGRMAALAVRFAEALGGELVDDRRQPLTDAALAAIAAQIAAQQALLAQRGISPGGELARRLFA